MLTVTFILMLEQISHYDIMDFLTWSMFEGRSQEHLTVEETAQLDTFLIDVEDLFRRFLNDEGEKNSVSQQNCISLNIVLFSIRFPFS